MKNNGKLNIAMLGHKRLPSRNWFRILFKTLGTY